MTNAIQALFQYAQEELILPLLRADPDYQAVSQNLQDLEDSLAAQLDGRQKERLEELVSEHNLMLLIHQRAMFQAGLLVARDLPR